MKRETRYGKERRVKEVMSKILEQHPEGIDSEKFVTQVREQIAVSRGKIFDLIKLFNLSGQMVIEFGPKDRRRRIYKPILERVKTGRKVYQATEFIETLENPISDELLEEIGGCEVSIAYFMELSFPEEDEHMREGFTLELKKKLKQLLRVWLEGIGRNWTQLVNQLPFDCKVVIVQRVSKRGKSD